MQKALRDRNEVFGAAVLWKPGVRDGAALEAEMRRIRDAGFSAVRFHQFEVTRLHGDTLDFSLSDTWLDAAERAGIGLIFHLNTALKARPEIVDCIGLQLPVSQWEVNDSRIVREDIEQNLRTIVSRYKTHSALYMWAGFGEPGASSLSLTNDYDRAQFGNWVEEQYGSLEQLDEAWNIYPEAGTKLVSSFQDAWRFAEFPEGVTEINGITNQKKIYGAKRDRARFQTDRAIAWSKWLISIIHSIDDIHPVAVGSHQLFLNQPSLGWDIAEYARTGDLHFSSIHMSWHFDAVEGEVDRPVYMQARKTRDYFKGGWTSAFETTGGAVQYSGGYGNAMTEGLMRRLCLSYVAAGNVNLAFWTWNHRPGGWEMGEYGLTSLSGSLTPWGKVAGSICKHVSNYREELWDADHQPIVGLLESWDTDAILLNEPDLVRLGDGDASFTSGTKMQACRARIGAARILINQGIPFSYISETDIKAGILACYPILYAPHLRAASEGTLKSLAAYVESGGILIGDVQFGFCDQWGKVHTKGQESIHNQIFGSYADVIHDTRTNPLSLNGIDVQGFYSTLELTRACVQSRFSDGSPALTVAKCGEGLGIFLNFDSGLVCEKPGNTGVEQFVGSLMKSIKSPGYDLPGAVSFRLSTAEADHYFVINGGSDLSVPLVVRDANYISGMYVLEGIEVPTEGPCVFQVPKRSAVWVRMQKGDVHHG